MRRLALLFLVCFAVSRAATADVPSTAQRLAGPFLADCAADRKLSELTTAYNSGNWAAFQKQAQTLLDALAPPQDNAPSSPAPACAPIPPGAADEAAVSRWKTEKAAIRGPLDYRQNFVVLIWLAASPLGSPQVMRAVIHAPIPEPYSADVPGIGGFTEVFLSASLDAGAASFYVSVPEKDPFTDQLPEFIKAIFGPLSSTIAGIAGASRGGGRESAARVNLAVTVSRVVLPIRRASVHLVMKVKDLISQKDFADAIGALATKLRFDGAGRSTPARTYVQQLAEKLPTAAQSNCGPPPSIQSDSGVSRGQACRDALDRVLKQEYDVALAARPAPSDDDADLIASIDTQFRAVAVGALSTNADLDITFKNRPLTRFTLGAGGAVIATASLNRIRVKVADDSGKVVSDPLTRVMTLAFVNWSPKGYDGSAAKMSSAERVRPFFGVALTPDFGPVGGVNVLLTRGIGLVGGFGVLFGKGADAEEIDKDPPAKEDPFKLAVAKTLFFGISYSYK